MANQRKKGMEKVSFWLTKAEKNNLRKFADRHGLNMTNAMRTFLNMLDTIENAMKENVESMPPVNGARK